MMIAPVPRLALLLLMAGCIPDFQLDQKQFETAEAGPMDAPAEDAAGVDASEDASVDVGVDAGLDDTGEHPDAEVDSGEHPDAAPDAEIPDVGFVENCENGIDDDMDDDADCADADCNLYVGAGWQCRGGVRAETDCTNNIDDDGNDGFDCHDPDCGCTAGVLLCCPNGRCLQLGQLCGG